MQFERPIPGESLTRPPKQAPFERPPEVSDPMEALDIHIENLQKDGVAEDIVFFIEEGLDIQTLVEGILRSAVMEGIHSIDVSLIIAPVIHEFVKGIALRADVDFKEGFELKKEKRALAYARDVEKAKRFLKDKGFKKPKETEEDNLEKTEVPVVEDQMLAEAETEPQQGLMARRV